MQTKNPIHRAGLLATSAAAIILLSACATRDVPTAPLQNARTTVGAAANNPKVVQLAPLELKAATESPRVSWRPVGLSQTGIAA